MGIKQLLMGGGASGSLVCGLYSLYGTTVGYGGLAGGSISPTSIFGFPINQLTYSSYGSITLALLGNVPNGIFSTLVLNGQVFTAANASYSYGSGITNWSWAAPNPPLSYAGQVAPWSVF
jgi:hypothetical protein